jgi:hypothetical protein
MEIFEICWRRVISLCGNPEDSVVGQRHDLRLGERIALTQPLDQINLALRCHPQNLR